MADQDRMKRGDALRGLGILTVAGTSQRTAFAADVPLYRIGATPIASGALVYFAQNLGYFSREGFNVTIAPAGNGDQTAAAIVGGSLEFGGLNTLSLAIAHQNGIPLKIIAPGAAYDDHAAATQLLVLRDSTASTARDLGGKVVAVNELEGAAHIATQAWVDRGGGDSKAVRFTEMPFGSMPAALTSRRVDAAVIAEPGLTFAKKDSRVLGNCYGGIGPRWLINVYVATDAWIREHPEAVRGIGCALHQTAVWSNRHRADTISLESSISKVAPEVVAASTRTTFAEGLDRGLIQPVIDAAVRYGVLANRFPAADLMATVPK